MPLIVIWTFVKVSEFRSFLCDVAATCIEVVDDVDARYAFGHRVPRLGQRYQCLWQSFWRSVKGCRFCRGLKIAISHWLSQSPLTLGWRYRAGRDKKNNAIYFTSDWPFLFSVPFPLYSTFVLISSNNIVLLPNTSKIQLRIETNESRHQYHNVRGSAVS